MKPETSAVSTKDWLEATKDMVITAYVDLFTLTFSLGERPFTKEDFEASLRKVAQPHKDQSSEEKSET